MTVVLSLSGGFADAQEAEVHNPWDNANGSSVASQSPEPSFRGDRVALRSVGRHFPAWVLMEVLNPWGNRVEPNHRMQPQERTLTLAARRRAAQLLACFPARHGHAHHATRLYPPSPAPGVNDPLSVCLRQAMEDLRPPSELFTLALGFDAQGLREVYVRKTHRD